MSSKLKLAELNKSDSERNIKDIGGFFDYMMETANPYPTMPERPMLSQTDLNKLALL